MCTVLIEQPNPNYEWMKTLPFLHIITLDDFKPSEPFSLPITEQKIKRTLFCGLDISSFCEMAMEDNRLTCHSINASV